MKTEAALLVQTGTPLVVAEIEVPALKPGQVLVEIAYSGACGTQVMEWRGDKGEDKWVPHCLGHEGTGTVLETAGGVTTFQRHAVVSENRLTLLPQDLPMDVAVLLGCAAPTGMGAVYNVLKVQPGNAIAVFGTGGIGLNALMAAALAGAMPVIGIDPNPTRRALAKIYGATHVIDPSVTDVLGEIRKIVPQGVDLAVESSGVPAVMEQAVNATRQQGGRAVVIGNARHGALLSLNPGVFNQGKSLLGTWGGDSVPDRDYGRFGRLLGSGRFPVRDLLSKPYSLEEADQALQDLAAGKIGRPLIDMSLRRSR